MRVAALTIAAAAVVAAGCGGKDAGVPYAGVSSYDAAGAAQDVFAEEREDSASPLYRKEGVVAAVKEGHRADGGEAWVVTLENFDHHVYETCIFVWGKRIPFKVDYTYDVGPCPPSV